MKKMVDLKVIPKIDINYNAGEYCPLPNGYDEKVWDWKVSEARKNKLWALDKKNDDAWWKMASEMSHEMLLDRLQDSVCDMARESYNYFHHRSHAKNKESIYGWGSDWLDPAWHRKWVEITGEEIREEDISWI